MDLYEVVRHKKGKLKHQQMEPDHAYTGELIHHVAIAPLYNIKIIKRIAVVSKEERKDDYVLHLYYQGVRLFGTRIGKDKPLVNVSYSILNTLAFEIHDGIRL
jgi:hypothetical protein